MKNSYHLPSGWEWKRLGDICELVYGDALPQHLRKNGGIPVYGSNGQIGLHNIAMTNGPTIIVGRKGSIGEVKYSDVPCWIIDTAYYVRLLVEIDLKFLYRLLDSLNLSKLNKSSAIPGLNRDDVYKLNIALPPLPEQSRIATIIDAQLVVVEKARQAAEEQMVAAEALIGAHLREVFNFEEVPPGWEWKRLEEVGEIVTGSTPSKADSENYGEEYNFFKPADLEARYSVFESTDKLTKKGFSFTRKLPEKSVLVTCIGATIGKTGFARVIGACNQQINAIIPNKNNHPEYLYFVCISDYFQKSIIANASTMTLPILKKSKFINIPIPVPPLDEQRCIADYLEQKVYTVKTIKTLVAEQMVYINALPASILRRAFNGEF